MSHDSQGFERNPLRGELVHAQTAMHVEYPGHLYGIASTDRRRQLLDDPDR